MRTLLASLLVLLLASCGCKEGTATFKAQLLKAEDGKAYVVRHHMGCVFSVDELPK